MLPDAEIEQNSHFWINTKLGGRSMALYLILLEGGSVGMESKTFINRLYQQNKKYSVLARVYTM